MEEERYAARAGAEIQDPQGLRPTEGIRAFCGVPLRGHLAQ